MSVAVYIIEEKGYFVHKLTQQSENSWFSLWTPEVIVLIRICNLCHGNFDSKEQKISKFTLKRTEYSIQFLEAARNQQKYLNHGDHETLRSTRAAGKSILKNEQKIRQTSTENYENLNKKNWNW